MGRRILLTGQSGIESKKIIINFFSHYAKLQTSNPPRYLKLETYIKDVYIARQKSKGVGVSENVWADLLIEPIPFIYEWWKQAFAALLEDIAKAPDADYILNMHACWYHHDTVEYLSLPNFKLLAEYKPTMVIAFIDDIYDMQLRLKQKGQFLDNKIFDRPTEMIKTAMQVLDWRSKEILISRHIAKEFEIPHFLFAIKHEQATLYDLIFSDKKRVYLSHPISEVRRLEGENKMEKATAIKAEITEISKQLANAYVPLLPTTIDELRLKKSAQSKDCFTYGLSPRWEEEKYKSANSELLYIAPDNSSHKAYFGEAPLNDRQEELYQELLITFFDRIGKQVSARDKKMVEQCEVLFVYRPCFNGNMSKGVLAEINYYHKLLEDKPDQKTCIIYCPMKDQHDLKITAIENEIKNFFRLTRFKFLENEKAALLQSYDNESEMAELVKEFLGAHDLDLEIIWGVLDKEVAREEKETILDFIRNAKRTFNVWIEEKYRSQAGVGLFFEEDNLTAAQIIAKIS